MESERLYEQARNIRQRGGSYEVYNGLQGHAAALARAARGGMDRDQTSQIVRDAREFWERHKDEIQRYPLMR